MYLLYFSDNSPTVTQHTSTVRPTTTTTLNLLWQSTKQMIDIHFSRYHNQKTYSKYSRLSTYFLSTYPLSTKLLQGVGLKWEYLFAHCIGAQKIGARTGIGISFIQTMLIN